MAQKSSSSFDSDINFSKVLFLHINRIAMSDSQHGLDASVNMLESLLYPYLNKRYGNAINDAKRKMNNDNAAGKKNVAADFTQSKLRALMDLAEAKGLLLTKEAYGYDDDEEDDIEENEEAEQA